MALATHESVAVEMPLVARFENFCKVRGVRLTRHQAAISELLLGQGLGSGKTFLIKLLYEFDKTTGVNSNG